MLTSNHLGTRTSCVILSGCLNPTVEEVCGGVEEGNIEGVKVKLFADVFGREVVSVCWSCSML